MKPITLIFLSLTLMASWAGAQFNPMTLVGEYYGEFTENLLFGQSTTAGDFDNDGQEEFIIGAPGWNNHMGKSYLYDWNGDWPTTPIWTPHGTIEGRMYDLCDQNVGDINGDGIVDFSLQEVAFGPAQEARLDLYFGSTGLDTFPDWEMWSGDSVCAFGNWLDSCGDVNGDGGNDFIMEVEESNYWTCFTRIYHGGDQLDTIPDWEYPIGSYAPCCGLGDVNGDGFADVMILDANEGPPKLFLGGNPMDTIPDLIFYDWALEGVGGGVGDINGDGYNDFCMPMRLPDSTLSYDQVYFGGPDVDNLGDAILQNRFGECWASLHCVSCGDFNGDGYSDIASGTGDPYWGNVVYIYLGSPWFNPVPDAVVTDYSIYYEFGQTISSGDVNGDGRDELLVSAVNYGWFGQGKVYLYTGPDEWIDYGAGVEPEELRRYPGWFRLEQNYPNPFNSATSIHFELGKPSQVNLAVYDLLGNKVNTMIKQKQMCPGGYNVSWTGKNAGNRPVSSGIYLIELRVDQYRQIRKMALLR